MPASERPQTAKYLPIFADVGGATCDETGHSRLIYVSVCFFYWFRRDNNSCCSSRWYEKPPAYITKTLLFPSTNLTTEAAAYSFFFLSLSVSSFTMAPSLIETN